MILKRLYELAEREGLLQDPAFDSAPVACLINIGPKGEYLGVQDLRKRRSEPSKRKGAPPRITIGKGKQVSVPLRPIILAAQKARKGEPEPPRGWKTTDPASSGEEKPAVFLVDTLPRVLPLDRLLVEKDPKKLEKERAKHAAQRSTFWRFLDHAAAQTNDPALVAVQSFGQSLRDDPALQDRLTGEIEAGGFPLTCICTFAWQPNEGVPVIDRKSVRDWWHEFFVKDRHSQESDSFQAFCQVTERVAPIPQSVKPKINGLVPIGCLADAYLVTGLQATGSYNLSGATTAMLSDQALDGFTRALNALIGNNLPGRPRTSLRIAKAMFLFWTRHMADLDDLMTLETASPDQVARLLESAKAGKRSEAADSNDFYCLCLSGNSARVIVRDYLEARCARYATTWRTGSATCAFEMNSPAR